jgi:hypothetical protein
MYVHDHFYNKLHMPKLRSALDIAIDLKARESLSTSAILLLYP